MRNTHTASLIACALIASALPAAAMAESRNWRPYGWIDFGQVNVRDNNFQRLSHLAEDDQRQPALGFGARWHSGFSIEAGYVDVLQRSHAESSYISPDPVTGDEFVVRQLYNSETDSAFVLLGWTWPITSSKWSVTTSAGLHRASFKTSFTSSFSDFHDYTYRTAGHDFSYALRVDYAIAERWRLGVGMQRFVLDALELDRSTLRLSYDF